MSHASLYSFSLANFRGTRDHHHIYSDKILLFSDVSQSHLLLTEKTVSVKLSSSIYPKRGHYPIALLNTLVYLDCAQVISSTALLDI